MRRVPCLVLALAVAASGLTLAASPTVVTNPLDCPDQTATFAGTTPTPETQVPGFPYRRVLSAEIADYVDKVASASDRVRAANFAQAWSGQDLVYALVTSPENHVRMDEIVAANRALRDPRFTDAEAADAIAATMPAIVWYAGNVHGNETSGADAAISLLHDLADRTDCTITSMLESLVIGIIPTQNPDGRDTAARQNAYAFDMNRDWFAGTQPETAGKLNLLREYPPALFIDAHEMGSSDFFFPPNADPIHHEIADEVLGWIDDIYAPAIIEEFAEHQATQPTEWDYFNYNTYDLFYMGYGDTVPTTAYGAAGMTFEKGTADPDHQKHIEQYVAGFVSLRAASANRERILRELWKSYDDAMRDGAVGFLEPNLVVEPQNKVVHEVPDVTVRNYFLLESRGQADVRRLVDRLTGFGVEVHRLDADLKLASGVRPGLAGEAVTVPAGSWWIPMAQPQKRWIQALLGEDHYVPFDYFYDVSSWSNPQLMNVDVVATAESVRPAASPLAEGLGVQLLDEAAEEPTLAWFPGDTGQAVAFAAGLSRAGFVVHRSQLANAFDGIAVPAGSFLVLPPQGVTAAAMGDGLLKLARQEFRHLNVVAHLADEPLPGDARPFRTPRIALFRSATSPVTLVSEAHGHLTWLLDQYWKLPYDALTSAELAAGELSAGGYDVLLVPAVATADLGPAQVMVEQWITDGGTYVGTARGGTGGTAWAVGNGWTTSTYTAASGTVGGTTFRIDVDPTAGPVALGSSGVGYWFNLPDRVLSRPTTGRTVASYPTKDQLFFSGYGVGVDAWADSAVVVEEVLGQGRVVLFSGEPSFRGLTEGPSFLLANALMSDSQPADRLLPQVDEDPAAVARAVASLTPSFGPGRALVIEVQPSDAAATARVLAGHTPDVVRERTVRGTVRFTVPNPRGLDVESHPFSWLLPTELAAAGVRPIVAFL